MRKKLTGIPTFGEQAALWLQTGVSRQRSPFRPATARTYKSQIDSHLGKLAKLGLDVVGNAAVRTIVKDMVALGFAPTTISLNINIIKEIRASAVNSEGEELYPYKWNATVIDAPEVNKKTQKKPIASAQTVQDGLKCLNGPVAPLVALLAGSGLRINEALAITGSAYPSPGNYWDGEKIIVHVQRTGVGSISSDLKPTKTQAGEREVDLSPELNKYLREKFPYLTTGFLFPQSESFYRQQLVKCGIIGGFHSLRRFRVTHLRLQGIPDALIHFWVGHEDETVTDSYTMVGPEIQKRKQFAEQAGLGFELEAK